MVHRYKNSERQTGVESEGSADVQAGAPPSHRIRRVGMPVTALLLVVLAVVSSVLWMHMALAMTRPGYEGPDREGSAGLRARTAESLQYALFLRPYDDNARKHVDGQNPNHRQRYNRLLEEPVKPGLRNSESELVIYYVGNGL